MVTGKTGTESSEMVSEKTGTGTVRWTGFWTSLVSSIDNSPSTDWTPVLIRKTDSGKTHWHHLSIRVYAPHSLRNTVSGTAALEPGRQTASGLSEKGKILVEVEFRRNSIRISPRDIAL
ncbi:hypothetical protein TNIN_57671 [Trichonephila inaurata madagascariensis]|uniref:Uncharacterized protein n=1 Tax=Trichonephila inaurata madagascariensis TaxID=2747483 RepID=A0A8X6J5S2_9ARAC|nr:hypothetical protein TNIN_57671 [Trichonephila inaurata madagascariensis]